MTILDPKPTVGYEKYEWEHLNKFIQSSFKSSITRGDKKPFSKIDVNSYKMSKEEIIEELKVAGYKITEQSETMLLLH